MFNPTKRRPPAAEAAAVVDTEDDAVTCPPLPTPVSPVRSPLSNSFRRLLSKTPKRGKGESDDVLMPVANAPRSVSAGAALTSPTPPSASASSSQPPSPLAASSPAPEEGAFITSSPRRLNVSSGGSITPSRRLADSAPVLPMAERQQQQQQSAVAAPQTPRKGGKPKTLLDIFSPMFQLLWAPRTPRQHRNSRGKNTVPSVTVSPATSTSAASNTATTMTSTSAAVEQPPSPPLAAADDPMVVAEQSVNSTPVLAPTPLDGPMVMPMDEDSDSDSSISDAMGTPATAAGAAAGEYVYEESDEAESDDYDDDWYVPVDDAYDAFVFIRRIAGLTRPPVPAVPALVSKPAHGPRVTLVLDLDETLVHCSTEPIATADVIFPVTWNGIDYQVYAMRRPFLREFMDEVSRLFEVVVFTASQRVYANKLLDILDPEFRWFRHRLFRDSCAFVEGNYVKDLAVLGRDLRQTAIIDNSPQAFGLQYNNGIPILSWFDSQDDTELLKLLPFLRKLAACPDVRPLIRNRYRLFKRIEIQPLPSPSQPAAGI